MTQKKTPDSGTPTEFSASLSVAGKGVSILSASLSVTGKGVSTLSASLSVARKEVAELSASLSVARKEVAELSENVPQCAGTRRSFRKRPAACRNSSELSENILQTQYPKNRLWRNSDLLPLHQVVCRPRCLFDDFLFAGNATSLHQDTTVANDGVYATAVGGKYQVRDEVEVGREGRRRQVY